MSIVLGGVKDDKGKLRWSLLPFDSIEQVLNVLEHGADKYGDRNWERGFVYSRLFDACIRHVVAWHRGEDLDRETNHSHLAHACCCLLFLLAFISRGTGVDDRPSKIGTPV